MLSFEIHKEDVFLNQAKIFFVFGLDAIHVDINPLVDVNDCEDVIGQVGMSPEFYFQEQILSKMTLEFPMRKNISTLEELNARSLTKLIETTSERGGVKMKDHPDLFKNPPFITDLLLSINPDFALFLFDNYDPEIMEESITSDELNIVELNESIYLGINRSDKTLYFTLIKNFLDEITFSESILSKKNIGDERFRSLQEIIKKSLNNSLTKELFKKRVADHYKRFSNAELPNELITAERSIIERCEFFLENKE